MLPTLPNAQSYDHMSTVNGVNGRIPDFDDPPPESQLAILRNLVQQWTNTRFQATAMYRVGKRVGEPPEQLDNYRKEIARCELWMQGLQDEIAVIERSIHPGGSLVEP